MRETRHNPAETPLPEYRERLDPRETRTLDADVTITTVEKRSGSDDKPELVVRGLAAAFDSWSKPIWGMFRERIARGAFRRVLGEAPDVPLIVNHDMTTIPLARTGNETLHLVETVKGLEFEAVLRESTAMEDLHAAVKRGDLSQMSFAFTVKRDEWIMNEDELDDRTILEMGQLFEISLVTNPAYDDTHASADERGVIGITEEPAPVGVEASSSEGSASEHSGRAIRQEPDHEAHAEVSASEARAAHEHRARAIAINRKRSRHHGHHEAHRGAHRRP
jgi:HK97 family phage prohead protease